MAVNQPLKGSTSKIYSVINNFSNGIDKSTSDDIAQDNTFEGLSNFCNSSKGELSKRQGIVDMNIPNFINAIINGEYNKEGNTICLIEPLWNEDTVDSVLERLGTFYKHLDKDIIGVQVLEKSDTFVEAMLNYKSVLEGTWVSSTREDARFRCILVLKEEYDNQESVVCYIDFDIHSQSGLGYGVKGNLFRISIEYVEGDRWVLSDGLKAPIDMISYGEYTYFPTGNGYLVRVENNPVQRTMKENYPEEHTMFQLIGGEYEDGQSNLYTPVPQDLTNIGFNLLASEPLTHYENNGTAGKIRGVFYTIKGTRNDGETITYPTGNKIPYNKEFNMNIIYTGVETYTVSSIQYRENNGDTDTESNPYKDVTSTKISTNPCVYRCSDINIMGSVEILVKLSNGDEFISYVTSTSITIPDTGLIEDLDNLILSSTRMKIINTQMVLYGNSGYVFFSDFENFTYFPNYYYIYVGDTLDEKVMSINYFRQYYAVFTNKRIKRMSGSFGASDFGVYPLNDYVGCANEHSVCAVGNNLLFVGNDGVYKLKQGYLGEGTENVEKIDNVLNGEINMSNTLQAFTLNDNYIVANNNNNKWFIYNLENDAFYEYNLEPANLLGYNGESLSLPYTSIFKTSTYDKYGDYAIIPSRVAYEEVIEEEGYSYTEIRQKTHLCIFRFKGNESLSEDIQFSDGYPFISKIETHNLSLGYPTNTKKFKDIYIKLSNKTGHEIPLYVTIYVDDNKVIDPNTYAIKYDIDTNTFYYVLKCDNNESLKVNRPLGEFTLGEDYLGEKTIQQIKFRVASTGRSIKIVLADGYDESSDSSTGETIRHRNIYDFSIQDIGISYKIKKVKEG